MYFFSLYDKKLQYIRDEHDGENFNQIYTSFVETRCVAFKLHIPFDCLRKKEI